MMLTSHEKVIINGIFLTFSDRLEKRIYIQVNKIFIYFDISKLKSLIIFLFHDM